MPLIRYRIQTIMMVIAAVAAVMGLLRWTGQYDEIPRLALFIILLGPQLLFGWFLQKRQRQLSESQVGQSGETEGV